MLYLKSLHFRCKDAMLETSDSFASCSIVLTEGKFSYLKATDRFLLITYACCLIVFLKLESQNYYFEQYSWKMYYL